MSYNLNKTLQMCTVKIESGLGYKSESKSKSSSLKPKSKSFLFKSSKNGSQWTVKVGESSVSLVTVSIDAGWCVVWRLDQQVCPCHSIQTPLPLPLTTAQQCSSRSFINNISISCIFSSSSINRWWWKTRNCWCPIYSRCRVRPTHSISSPETYRHRFCHSSYYRILHVVHLPSVCRCLHISLLLLFTSHLHSFWTFHRLRASGL